MALTGPCNTAPDVVLLVLSPAFAGSALRMERGAQLQILKNDAKFVRAGHDIWSVLTTTHVPPRKKADYPFLTLTVNGQHCLPFVPTLRVDRFEMHGNASRTSQQTYLKVRGMTVPVEVCFVPGLGFTSEGWKRLSPAGVIANVDGRALVKGDHYTLLGTNVRVEVSEVNSRGTLQA